MTWPISGNPAGWNWQEYVDSEPSHSTRGRFFVRLRLHGVQALHPVHDEEQAAPWGGNAQGIAFPRSHVIGDDFSTLVPSLDSERCEKLALAWLPGPMANDLKKSDSRVSSAEPASGPASNALPGEHDVVDLPPASRAQVDHFVDVNKMVRDDMPRHFTGRFRLVEQGREVVPFGVPEQVLEVARQPIFDASFGLLGTLPRSRSSGLGRPHASSVPRWCSRPSAAEGRPGSATGQPPPEDRACGTSAAYCSSSGSY